MPQAEQALSELEQQLHNLRVFACVADARSVTRASELLFKASSAITRSVLDLERSLGTALFERTPRGMLLNAYGQAVRVRARRIDDEIGDAANGFLRASSRRAHLSRNAIVGVLFSGRKLELLIRIAELRSMSAVAAAMGMTQAGASMALSRIEAVFAQPLFHRRLEGMVATEAAERLVVHARRVLAELRHLASDLSAIAGAPAGTVVIGSTHLGRTHHLPAAIGQAVTAHSRLRVTSVEGSYEQLIGKLKSGDIDLVFTVLRPNDQCPGLVNERLFTDHMSVLARAGHPLARRARLSMAELLDATWIFPRSHALGKAQVDDGFERLGLQPPTPAVETGDLATLRQLLGATDMLAVTSASQLTFELDSGLLVELPVALPGTALEIGLITREGAMLSPAAQAVVAAVRALVQDGEPQVVASRKTAAITRFAPTVTPRRRRAAA
jgi:LysR family transcriptional regulator of gallate degradation